MNPTKQSVGRYGIWSIGLRAEDPARRSEQAEAAAELEQLGYGALWLGSNSTARHAAPLLAATGRIAVGTSIQNIWQYEAPVSAAAFAQVDAAHPGRFVLGLGVGHGGAPKPFRGPVSALAAYLDALDAAGVPADRRVVAAIGPRALRLVRERAAGTVPYLVTPDYTAAARETLGEGPLLAPELKVVPESDPARARTLARAFLAPYLTLPNYTSNFLRHGFTEDDLRGGGSDRLVDSVFAWGTQDAIRDRINAFLDAGADHVALQVVDGNPRESLPRETWRRLATLLG
ncbi:TIGR03620 family F420-dependent LLM class oxidoreductase [Streptomyces sp. NPDC096205]|uniref:TIGR03620 family F420-dependent LLM class oxidoreductase n=1 Tax=Streptomyces sp. NPDC096205 TaxID=3366081 RepID=UPI00380DBD41